MNRRFLGVVLTLVCSCVTQAGCQGLHHGLRTEDRDPDLAHASAETETTTTTAESESNKILDVQSDRKQAKPFFRPSRLTGGLSSEAREIESSLGIH